MTLDDDLREAIIKGKELEELESISMKLRRVPIHEEEFKFYKECLVKYQHYYDELFLSKYFAVKDMIQYFKMDLQPNSKN